MARLAWCTALVLTAGCATTEVERARFSEVIGPLDAPLEGAPVPAKAAAPRVAAGTLKAKSPAPEANASLELEGALVAFSQKARVSRASTRAGTVMPAAQVENWHLLLAELDRFLAKKATESSSFDIIRARITAEAELEMDARSYGDFQSEIAESVVERVTSLAVRMADVRRLHVKTREQKTDFAWPVSPVAVTSLFGKRIHPMTKKYQVHLGLDLAAEAGQLISAAARGTVIQAEFSGGHGYSVEIAHLNGVMTRYSHLSQLLVEAGTVLDKGDPVGLAGSTGMSTGPHLHFEFWRAGKPCDPLEELSTSTGPSHVASM